MGLKALLESQARLTRSYFWHFPMRQTPGKTIGAKQMSSLNGARFSLFLAGQACQTSDAVLCYLLVNLLRSGCPSHEVIAVWLCDVSSKAARLLLK